MITAAETPVADVELPLPRKVAALRDAGVGWLPGCYAVFSAGGECLYVGSSVQVECRIMQHWINAQDGNGVQWRLTGSTEYFRKHPFAPAGSMLKVWFSDDHKALEKELILSLKPTRNHPPKGGYPAIKSKLM